MGEHGNIVSFDDGDPDGLSKFLTFLSLVIALPHAICADSHDHNGTLEL